MNNNWIELHHHGKSVIINTSKIIIITEYGSQHSYICLSHGIETAVDESYNDIVKKLGINQLNK